jgi:uncharacterized protein (DUF433 family)
MVARSSERAHGHDALIEQWIEPDPYRPGPANARLKKYAVHVWALIGYLPAVDNDIAVAAQDYDVPTEAVEAALAYYARHKALIDDRIAAIRA